MDRTQSTALLREARAGSAEALDRLMRRCAARLLAVIRLRLGSTLRRRMESRDVLQGVLLKGLARLDEFERSDMRSLMAWLARIAENEIRDLADYHHRQRRDVARVVQLDGGLDGIAARVRSQLSQLVLDERLERLERALERLETDHREVIVLHKFHEMTFREIGERMQRSPDACRMLLARALAALTLRVREAERR